MSVKEVKVCIIGAGISGLKTAHTLLNDPRSKFTKDDVLIVEGQDYIGGRVKTDKTSSKLGYSYDLGGAWFHDALTNVVLKESVEDKSFDINKDGYFDDLEHVYYHNDHKGELPYNKWRLNRVGDELFKFIEIYYYESLDRKDMNLLEITDIYIERYKDRLTPEQIKYLHQVARYSELWFGVSSDKISAKYSAMEHEGRNLYNLKGFSYLVDKLLKGIPKENILLNHKVSKINRADKYIETQHGTIKFDYLVVTVPLSILKLPQDHEYGLTWEPKLPDSMTEAINKMSFGALGKVIFEFDNVWWDNEIERFVLFSEDLDNTDIGEPLKSLPKKSKYPILAINYAAMHKSDKASLVLLTQSPLTDYVEAHPDEAWEYFKPMLQQIVTSGKKISEPINVLTTKWTQNPYARGSYSAVLPNDDPESIIVQLSGEMEGIALSHSPIRFAGEHTISEGDGCIHGAYMSGEREAQWIINNFFFSKKMSKL